MTERGDAWKCPECEQKNMAWSVSCGRCDRGRYWPTPPPGEKPIAPSPDLVEAVSSVLEHDCPVCFDRDPASQAAMQRWIKLGNEYRAARSRHASGAQPSGAPVPTLERQSADPVQHPREGVDPVPSPASGESAEDDEPSDEAKCWMLRRLSAFIKDGGGSFRSMLEEIDMDYASAYTAGGMDVSNALMTEDTSSELSVARAFTAGLPDSRAWGLALALRAEVERLRAGKGVDMERVVRKVFSAMDGAGYQNAHYVRDEIEKALRAALGAQEGEEKR